MVPLPKQLAEILLPYGCYGTHLDGNGNTIDPIKELENLKKTRQVLPDIWSATTIENFAVTAKRADPSDNTTSFKSFTDTNLELKWLESQVYISTNLFQITNAI